MKTLLIIILLITNLTWGDEIDFREMSINNPNTLFIDKKNLIKKINDNAIDIFNNYSSKYLNEAKFSQWGCRYHEVNIEDMRQLYLEEVSRDNYFYFLEMLGSFPIHYWCETTLRSSDSAKGFSNIYFWPKQKNRRVKKLISFYEDLVEQSWLLKLPKPSNDDQIAYELGVFIVSILFTYTLVEDDLKSDTQQAFKEHIKEIIKKYEYATNESLVGPNSVNSNHGFYFYNLKLASSIILNDNEMFRNSIRQFFSAIKNNSSESGIFKLDGKRGECALSYNYHGLNPVMAFLWNLKLQGYDLFHSKITNNHNIGEIIDSIYEASIDTNLFYAHQKKYGLTKDKFSRESCWIQDISKEESILRKDKNGMMRLQTDAGWIRIYESVFGKKKAERFKNIDAGFWAHHGKYPNTNAYIMSDIFQIGPNLSLGGISYIIYQDSFPEVDYQTVLTQ